MKIIAVPSRPAEVVEYRDDLRLRRDVEGGGGFVREDQVRLEEEDGRDHHALQHSARQFVRILTQPTTRLVDPDLVEHGSRPVQGSVFRGAVLADEHLGQEVADPVDRVDRGTRILEDHPDPPRAELTQFGLPCVPDLAPVEDDRA